MRRLFFIELLVSVVCLLCSAAATAQVSDPAPRFALVFGNAAYTAPDRPLKNPVSDARLMARTLKDLGFDVRLREDLDRRSMLAALREFEDALRKTKGIGFLYFAGHGVQVAGHNYIVPIGANLVRDVDAQKNALDADAILQSLRDTGAKLNILVLDACRNNPLLATSRDAGSSNKTQPGLAPMRPPEGALVAFATEPGRLASDGKDAGNGLYTRHLARWIKEPNLTIEQVFKRTREAVQTESKGEQVPTEYSVLTGADLYLASASLTSPPVVSPAPAATPAIPTKNSAAQASRSAVPTTQQSATAALFDTISSGEVARRQAEMTAAPLAMAAILDTATARIKLQQLGGSFTKQSYQQALENDDVKLFEHLIAAGWQLEAVDIVQLLDPRQDLWRLWPKKIMASLSLTGKALPVHAQLCDVDALRERFNNLPDLLRRGYDSPALESKVLFERETFNKQMVFRRNFYTQFCGAGVLSTAASRPPAR